MLYGRTTRPLVLTSCGTAIRLVHNNNNNNNNNVRKLDTSAFCWIRNSSTQYRSLFGELGSSIHGHSLESHTSVLISAVTIIIVVIIPIEGGVLNY